MTVGEIAELLHGKVVGDANAVISGLAKIEEASPDELTFIANPKYAKQAAGNFARNRSTDLTCNCAAKNFTNNTFFFTFSPGGFLLCCFFSFFYLCDLLDLLI